MAHEITLESVRLQGESWGVVYSDQGRQRVGSAFYSDVTHDGVEAAVLPPLTPTGWFIADPVQQRDTRTFR